VTGVDATSTPAGSVRVLTVIGSLRPGGAETFVANVLPLVRDLGVYVEVCALERTGPLLAPLEKAGIRVHDTPFPRAASRLNSVAMLRSMKAIRRIIKAGRFDIVHTYLYSSDVLGVTAARLAGCRRIIISRQSMHGWVHEPRRFLHAVEQVTNLFANEVIACSNAALKDAERHERVLPAIRTVIYNAVDAGAFGPARPGRGGPLRLVTVGALAHRKGQEYAIEAMADVTRSGVSATLDLVGGGPDEEMLRRKVAGAGLHDRVTFSGEQNDPRPHLARADVFLLPSRQEGFSVALLEAMASALPAIVTDVGGNAEALVDGKGGRVVPPLQPGPMAAAISELSNNRERLGEMGGFNRHRVEELFSLKASARRLADWYTNGPPPRVAQGAPPGA
jgi:glycosyltransferase involved in cell wall biosynthesis